MAFTIRECRGDVKAERGGESDVARPVSGPHRTTSRWTCKYWEEERKARRRAFSALFALWSGGGANLRGRWKEYFEGGVVGKGDDVLDAALEGSK